MNENVTLVFHGFLNLANLDKLALVEAINEYFDSNDREPIREKNDTDFNNLDLFANGKTCKCCGR
ncbi:MAG: hypothetical protein ACT4O9_03825 [Blastocatellia bacterium]